MSVLHRTIALPVRMPVLAGSSQAGTLYSQDVQKIMFVAMDVQSLYNNLLS